MQYALEKISTVAACDALLASAQKKKQDLERKMRNLGESIGTFRSRLDQIGQDSILVQALLIAYSAAYNALPEGTRDKASMNVKVKRLELRQARLERKAFTCNAHNLLAKEVKYNMLASQMAVLSTYISALENRKTILLHADLRVEGQTATSSLKAASSLPQPALYPISPTEKRVHKRQAHFRSSGMENSFLKSRKFLRLHKKLNVKNVQDRLKI